MTRAIVLLAICALASDFRANAGTVVLTPAADTTLFESSPEDNMGGWLHVASGTTGSGADRTRNRALLRFDLTSLPAGARITNAWLTIAVTGIPGRMGGGGPANSTFGIHRLLSSWGEGDKLGDRGFPASAGEATWRFRFAPDDNGAGGIEWSSGGGAAGIDYDAEPSASVFVAGLGSYQIGPSDSMLSDLADWIAAPERNFGWLLISQSEDRAKTARRFGSREDSENSPRLVIEYESGLSIDWDFDRENRELILRFEQRAGQAIGIERAMGVPSDSWIETGESLVSGEDRLVTWREPAGDAAGFFRLRVK